MPNRSRTNQTSQGSAGEPPGEVLTGREETPTIERDKYPAVFAILDDIEAMVKASFQGFYAANPRIKPSSPRSRLAQKHSLDGIRSIGHVLCDPKYRTLYAEDYRQCELKAAKLDRLEAIVREALIAEPQNPWILAFGRVIFGHKALLKVLASMEGDSEGDGFNEDGTEEPSRDG